MGRVAEWGATDIIDSPSPPLRVELTLVWSGSPSASGRARRENGMLGAPSSGAPSARVMHDTAITCASACVCMCACVCALRGQLPNDN